jgi:hypothetical protein
MELDFSDDCNDPFTHPNFADDYVHEVYRKIDQNSRSWLVLIVGLQTGKACQVLSSLIVKDKSWHNNPKIELDAVCAVMTTHAKKFVALLKTKKDQIIVSPTGLMTESYFGRDHLLNPMTFSNILLCVTIQFVSQIVYREKKPSIYLNAVQYAVGAYAVNGFVPMCSRRFPATQFMKIINDVTITKVQRKNEAQRLVNVWFKDNTDRDTLPMVLKYDEIHPILTNRCKQDLGLMSNYNIFHK